MKWMKISSAANSTVKGIKKLITHTRVCREEGRTIAEGIHLAKELLNRNELIQKVFLREGATKNSEISAILHSLDSLSVPCIELPNSLFNEISPVENSTGIFCEILIPDNTYLNPCEDIVYLDGVQDPGNVGTILRAALASGVKYFAASISSAYFWSPKVLRSAMGAHFQCHFVQVDTLKKLKQQSRLRCLVADARGGKSLYELTWDKSPVLWVFGSEGQGVSDDALQQADSRVFIPINPQVESLNVAMAATVCLFERKRIKDCCSEISAN